MSTRNHSHAATEAVGGDMIHSQGVCRLCVAALGLAILLLTGPSALAQTAEFDACLEFERKACDQVLVAEPDNLTALFMRGLAAELEGDHQAALQDFDATAVREPRHFGAQLWRHVAAASLGQNDADKLVTYLDAAKSLGPWPRALAELYLGKITAEEAIGLAGGQQGSAASEALCAAHYHAGRAAHLAGKTDEAMAHFRAALATGASHVFEYQAAGRALNGAL
jgi:lipoprotein NlpI